MIFDFNLQRSHHFVSAAVRYVDYGALIDPIIVNVNAAAEPFLDLHEDVIPNGFQGKKYYIICDFDVLKERERT